MSKAKARRPRVDKTYDQIRHRIAKMSVGVPLPPVSRLMRELAASQLTIQRAYGRLEAEGLVQRQPGKGVFVADPMQDGEFAVSLHQEWMAAEASPFARMTTSSIIQAFHAKNDRWKVKLHTGQKIGQDQREFARHLNLVPATGSHRLRGVIALCPLFEVEQQLESAGIPVVNILNPLAKYAVWFDYRQYLEDAVAHLAQAGCRKVGMIWCADGVLPDEFDHAINFRHALKQAGLVYRKTWVGEQSSPDCERYGYELFLKLWQQPERPDAIVMVDDILCRGVLRGIAEQGVSLPTELRLVTMANRYVDFPWPKPITRVEFDTDELAQAAVQMMVQRLQCAQLPQQHIIVPGKLVQGCTT